LSFFFVFFCGGWQHPPHPTAGVQIYDLLGRMPCILHMRQDNRRFSKVSIADLHPDPSIKGIGASFNSLVNNEVFGPSGRKNGGWKEMGVSLDDRDARTGEVC
jgi:hypothetical protein